VWIGVRYLDFRTINFSEVAAELHGVLNDVPLPDAQPGAASDFLQTFEERGLAELLGRRPDVADGRPDTCDPGADPVPDAASLRKSR
jgi:hypothetical protein